jgi:ubiquinone/menaquinone biosynthesis C-methylase UbiE
VIETKKPFYYPAEEVIEFYNKYLENPSKQYRSRDQIKGKKIHDFGVGGGRHLFFFTELGYDVTGTDISENAIEITQKELDRRGLKATLKLCPMTNLPFTEGEFDITISRATINHGTLQDMKRAVYEVARTTKKGGLFFLTVSSVRASDFNNGTEIVKDLTYAPNKGPENGLAHTFFKASTLAALLEPFFRIEEIYLSEHDPLLKNAPGATSKDEYFGSEYVIIGVRE